MATSKVASPPVVIHWFRKGLRLHDNPALDRAIKFAQENKALVRPIFILDTELPKSYKIGANRYRFLFEALEDLDNSFKALGGRLFVIRGKVDEVFENCFKTWNVRLVTFENDTEPYSKLRDAKFCELAKKHGVLFEGHWSHTLYDPNVLIKTNKGQVPKTYQKCLDVMSKSGPPPKAIPKISTIPLDPKDPLISLPQYNPPTLPELGIPEEELGPNLYPGGETEGLRRMETYISKTQFVQNFAKPNTSPNSLNPSTTVLSPYLKFGCISPRLFHEKLLQVKGVKTKPPVSLLGQLYWREFYYVVGTFTPNFTQMQGNSICKQINWDENEEYFRAWKEGRTGYPYIDSIMTQLRQEGWVHHLARHSVACFLTRGDLWLHWEKGQEVFEEYLLDADVYLNAGNWMWLSASAFFHQYYRVYSPIKFGQKTDPHGEYIRKYMPKLAKYPPQYIYEPWKAPLSVQKAAGCVIGKDYPRPIVDHETIVKVNLKRMNEAYSKKDKEGGPSSGKRPADSMDDDDDYADEIHKAINASPNKKGINSQSGKSGATRQPTIIESLKKSKRK